MLRARYLASANDLRTIEGTSLPIPFSNAADYMKALPHATLVPLPNVGHVPFEETPAAALVPLRRFLSQHSH